jgi:hypothetical protein
MIYKLNVREKTYRNIEGNVSIKYIMNNII